MVFQVYFHDPAYYYISCNEPIKAELYRLRKLIYETFNSEINSNRLSQNNIVIPKIDMDVDGEYLPTMKAVKMALNE
jgi:hypothetical protein